VENSKAFLKTNKILPRISFTDGKPRTLKIVDDKIDKLTDQAGQIVEGVKYKVLEGNEVKTFFTASIALITKLAEIAPNTMVKIQQRKYNSSGNIRTTYDVSKIEDGQEQPISPEVPDSDIPIVEEDEPQQGVPPEEEPPADIPF